MPEGNDDKRRTESPDRALIAGVLSEVERRPESRIPGVARGARLGGYHVVARLGRGAFAEVWRAREETLERDVALKLLRRQQGANGEAAFSEYLREARALSAAEHDHVVRIWNAGVLDGSRLPFISMELCVGSAAERKPLAPKEAARTLADVARGVASAHARGIVHRDIKPSNILFDSQGRAKLSDFGLSRPGLLPPSASPGAPDETQSIYFSDKGLSLLGTPAYMAPEQAQGGPATPLSDVYALGATLYYLLTGTSAYSFDASAGTGSLQELFAQITNPSHEPKPLPDTVPRPLARICQTAMSKEPEKRYQTAEKLAEDLEAWLAHRPTSADPPGRLRRSAMAARRNPIPTTLVLAVALVVIFGTVLTTQYALRAKHEAKNSEQTLEYIQNMLGVADPYEYGSSDARVSEVLDCAAERLMVDSDLDSELVGRISHIIGGVYFRIGIYPKADFFLQKAIAANSGSSSADQLRVAAVLHDYGWLKHDQRDYVAAEQAWQRALEIRRALLGEIHSDVAESLADIAVAKKHSGSRDVALTYFEQALEVARKTAGPTDEKTLDIMNDQAMLFLEIGQQRDAAILLRQVVAVRQKRFRADHTKVLQNNANLAQALRAESKFEEARELLLQTIHEGERKLGHEHPKVGEWKATIGGWLLAEGDLDESLRFSEEALTIVRSVQGEKHSEVLFRLADLARAFEAKQDRQHAMELMEQVVSQTRLALGEKSVDYAYQLVHLGHLLGDAGQLDGAMAKLVEAKSILEQIRGARDIEVSRRLFDFAKIQLQSGDCASAAASLTEGLELAREQYGPESEEVFRLDLDAMRLFQSLDRAEEVAALRDEAFRLCQIVHAEDEQILWGDMQAVVFELANAREYSKAQHLFRRILEIRERLFGPDEVAGDKNWLAWSLFPDGTHGAEEEELLRSAIETAQRLRGPSHSDTISMKHGLARVLLREGRFAEAEGILLGVLAALQPEPKDRQIDTMKPLIQLFESWAKAEPDGGHADQAAEWRSKLEILTSPAEPVSSSP